MYLKNEVCCLKLKVNHEKLLETFFFCFPVQGQSREIDIFHNSVHKYVVDLLINASTKSMGYLIIFPIFWAV